MPKQTKAIILIAIIATIRYLLKDIPNIEPITAGALVSGYYLRGKWTLIVPLFAIAISDVLIGNSPILIFTWSAFSVMGFITFLVRENNNQAQHNKLANSLTRKLVNITLLGLFASTFFFVWTNFGVWLISGMYTHTFQGFIQCYINAIPFFGYNLLSTIVFVPIAFGMYELTMIKLYKKNNAEVSLR